MKILPYIIGLILLTNVFACQQETIYPLAMQQAESLMNTRPDSALYLLQGMADSVSTLPEETQRYYHLLTIQAKDKQYITHTSDSLINSIVSFYEDCDDNDRLMMAYYYQGSVYRDMNDAPRALKVFQQVVDLDIPNYDLLAKAYNQMGTLFMYQGLYDEVIRVNKKAIELYLSQGKKNNISYSQRDIARMYDAKNMPDSVLFYYKEACNTALANKDTARYYGILGELGGYYYEIGKTDLTKQILRFVEQQPLLHNKTHIYTRLGDLYKDDNQLDSASYYYSKNLSQSNIRNIYYAYRGLYEIEKQKTNYKQAQEYIDKALLLKDSIELITKTEDVAKINALYNYQHIEDENYKLNSEKEKLKYRNLMLLFISMSGALGSIILIFIYKEKKRKELDTEKELRKIVEENYSRSQEAINNNLQKMAILKVQLEKAVNEKDALIAKHLQLEQKQLQTRNEEIALLQEEHEKRISDFRRTTIYKEFKQAASDENIILTPTKCPDKWNELREAINIAYPDFFNRLNHLCLNLSSIEMEVCLLTKLGLQPKEISTIEKYSRQGITNIRTRIYKKLQKINAKYSSFDHFIEIL